MAVSRTLLKATALKGIPPDECLQEINNILAVESLSTMFVTIFYGVLDVRNGALEYCNGGHNPPYLISNGEIKQLENIGGLFVGALQNIEYESKMMTLKPGDTLFLYTDGVTEAEDVNEDEFQTDRLETCLQKLNGEALPAMTERVFDAVQKFSEGMRQSDDITILTVRYNA